MHVIIADKQGGNHDGNHCNGDERVCVCGAQVALPT